MRKMVKELFILLEKYNLTLSAAESITGGKFSSLITSEEGSSKYFKGSFICYSNEFKYDILGIDKTIKIISKDMAENLSNKSREKANTDISISFTGNSSNNGIEGSVKGLSFISVSNKNVIETTKFKSSFELREEIIKDTSLFGLTFILKFILNNYE